MAKRSAAKAAPTSRKAGSKDVDYTIPGLISIVATVLITALFFAQPNVAIQASNIGKTIGGQACATAGGSGCSTSGSVQDSLAPKSCQVTSMCDGSRLIRQKANCDQYTANCQNGCEYRAGEAT